MSNLADVFFETSLNELLQLVSSPTYTPKCNIFSSLKHFRLGCWQIFAHYKLKKKKLQ